MPEPILAMFAVNGDQGQPTGRIERLEICIGQDTAADLWSGIWPPSACPRFSRLEAAVKISRRKFPVLNYSTWVGNWCWDASRVTPAVAADILNYLREIEWHNEGGLCDIGDQWERGEKFRPSDIARLAMTDKEFVERKINRALPGRYDVDAAIRGGLAK